MQNNDDSSEISSANKHTEAPRSGGRDDSLASVLSIGSLAILILVVFAFKDFILDANNIPSGSMIPTLKIGDYLFVNKMRYSLRIPFAGTEIWHIDDPQRGDIVTFIPPYENDKHYVKRVMGVPGDRIRIRPVRVCDLTGDLGRNSVPDAWARESLAGAEPGAGMPEEYCDRRPVQWEEPVIAVVEYRPQDRGPWLNYGPRPVPAAQARQVLTDSDNVGVLQPDQWPEDDYERTLPIVLKETVGGHDHLIVEKYLPGEGSRSELCPEIETDGCVIPTHRYLVMGDNRDDSKDSRMIGYIERENILGKALVIYFSINWYDEICQEYWDRFRNGSGDADATIGFRLEDFPPEEQYTSCSAGDTQTYRRSDESLGAYIGRYLWHTAGYRIPRMSVRWVRPGTLLE
jgi:signal peptidase I